MAEQTQAPPAKKIRRPRVEIEGGGQMPLFAALTESPPPAPAGAAKGLRFERGDAGGIAFAGLWLDEYLRRAGLTLPFVVRRLLTEQDWSPFQAKYRPGGRPPYDPQAMVGLVLMGLMRGLGALRELELLARTDLGIMWVTGGICPDHSVIGRFILLHAEILDGCFLDDLTRSALAATGTGTLAGDGTVIAAQASRFIVPKREALAAAAREAREAASQTSAAAGATPRDEGARAAAERAEAKAAAKAERLAAAAATLEGRSTAKAAKGKPAEGLSLHPDEAEAVVQPQKDKKTYLPSYKPMVLANRARLVVSAGVHPSSETAELAAHLDRAAAQGPVESLLLDASFHADGVLALAAERGIELLCPQGRSLDEGPWTKRSNKLFHKSRFSYEAASDSYLCPAQERLGRLACYAGTASEPGYVLYGSRACAECPVRARCTQSRQGRRIKRYAGDEAKEALQAKLTTAEARARYRKRQGMVEPVFSHLKEVQGLRRFRRRGLAKVRLEFALHIAAYNLSRVVALVPHLGRLGAAWGGLLHLLAALLGRLFDWRRLGARRSPAGLPWLPAQPLAPA